MRQTTNDFEVFYGNNGITLPATTRNYKTIKVTAITEGGFDGQVFLNGSDSDTPIDISLPVSRTNSYSPVQCVDMNDGNSLVGDTGIDFSTAPYNTDSSYSFEVNSNGIKQLSFRITGATVGLISLKITMYDKK